MTLSKLHDKNLDELDLLAVSLISPTQSFYPSSLQILFSVRHRGLGRNHTQRSYKTSVLALLGVRCFSLLLIIVLSISLWKVYWQWCGILFSRLLAGYSPALFFYPSCGRALCSTEGQLSHDSSVLWAELYPRRTVLRREREKREAFALVEQATDILFRWMSVLEL